MKWTGVRAWLEELKIQLWTEKVIQMSKLEPLMAHNHLADCEVCGDNHFCFLNSKSILFFIHSPEGFSAAPFFGGP